MSVRKSSHGTIFLIVSSGSPRALIASSLRSTSKKPFCPMTRSLHPPIIACGHRVRFVGTWREEFFEVPTCDFDSAPCLTMAVSPGGRPYSRKPQHGGRLCALWCLESYFADTGATFTALKVLQVPARVRQALDGSRLLPAPQEPPVFCRLSRPPSFSQQ